MTEFVKSRDGTTIALTTMGEGSNLILVDGAFCHREFGPNKELAEALKGNFKVTIYDRRGRGESGNTLPYSVETEIEDLRAVIEHIGGSAHLYGISSGAALALEAANAGLNISKLAVYEVPMVVDNTRKPVPEDYLHKLKTYLEAGEMGKVVSCFMKDGVGLPGFVVFMMRLMPSWKQLKELAPTVIYDTLILGDTLDGKPLRKERWENVKCKTVVINGSKSETWMKNSMKQLSTVLQGSGHTVLKGQNHMVKASALAPELIKFFE